MHWMRMGLGVRAGHQKWLNHFESAILFVHNYCVRMCVCVGCGCVWGVGVLCGARRHKGIGH